MFKKNGKVTKVNISYTLLVLPVPGSLRQSNLTVTPAFIFVNIGFWTGKNLWTLAKTGLAQWIEHWPADWKVPGSLPVKGMS